MVEETSQTAPSFQPEVESIQIGTLGDQPNQEDSLGFEPYVDAIWSFLTAPATRGPLTLSVEGKWGSGKTSFMEQLEKKLRENGQLTVKFNAWRHEEEKSLWAAFALELLEQLPKHKSLAKTVISRFARRWIGRVKLLWHRFNWKSVRHDALPILLVWLAIIIVLVSATIAAVTTTLDGYPLWQIIAAIFGGSISLAALGKFIGKIRDTGNILIAKLNKYLSCPDYEGHVSFIENFHRDFSKIVGAYAGNRNVHVFIDDLDRCDVPTASELMKALNLLISNNSRLIFVIGMDREKIAAGIACDYKDLMPYLMYVQGERDAAQNEKVDPAHGIRFAYEFVEKFIQLPFQVPVPEGRDIRKFLDNIGNREKKIGSTGWIRWLIEVTEKTLSAIWSAVRKRVRHQKEEPLLRPEQMGTGAADGSPETRLPEKSEEEKTKERREMTRLEFGRDSENFKKVALLIAPYLGNNPRRIIQFTNLLRLRAYLANETGLFDRVKNESDKVSYLTLQSLGKFTAISLKWPLLVSELADNPGLLKEMEYYAWGDEKRRGSASPDVSRWLREKGMVDLLREGCVKSEDSTWHSELDKFSMALVDVKTLLKVSPRIPRGVYPPPTSDASLDKEKTEGLDKPEEEGERKAATPKLEDPIRQLESWMVAIEGGQFQMGDGLDDDNPIHPVKLDSFEICAMPVTQAQYEAIMGDNPSRFKGPEHPVERVSWDNADTFCKRLSEKTGRKYTLPTEAQWEYACRAGSIKKYCFGDDEDQLGEYAWYDANSGNGTHPVGMKKPNNLGLYDMHGNVWEWCLDWYDKEYYANSPADNPTGPTNGQSRVVRGGSWGSDADIFAFGGPVRQQSRRHGRRHRVSLRPWQVAYYLLLYDFTICNAPRSGASK